MQQTASQPCVERITHRVLCPPSPTSAQSLFVCLSSQPVGDEKVQNMNPSTSWLPFLSYHRGHRWCCFKSSALSSTLSWMQSRSKWLLSHPAGHQTRVRSQMKYHHDHVFIRTESEPVKSLYVKIKSPNAIVNFQYEFWHQNINQHAWNRWKEKSINDVFAKF